MISRVVAVERALTSYQCGLGQIPGLVKLFVGSLYFAWKYFSPGVADFPLKKQLR